jgi:hypothetical protein
VNLENNGTTTVSIDTLNCGLHDTSAYKINTANLEFRIYNANIILKSSKFYFYAMNVQDITDMFQYELGPAFYNAYL